MAIPQPQPETLDAAIDALLVQLSDEERTRVAAMTDRELPELHMSLGMMLRNDFGLWGGNSALVTALDCWEASIEFPFDKDGRFTLAPDVANGDRASGIIIATLVRRLREGRGG